MSAGEASIFLILSRAVIALSIEAWSVRPKEDKWAVTAALLTGFGTATFSVELILVCTAVWMRPSNEPNPSRTFIFSCRDSTVKRPLAPLRSDSCIKSLVLSLSFRVPWTMPRIWFGVPAILDTSCDAPMPCAPSGVGGAAGRPCCLASSSPDIS